MKTHELIRKIRKTKGVSQLSLAQALRLSQAQVSRIESGKSELTVQQLQTIARTLSTSMAELFNEGKAN